MPVQAELNPQFASSTILIQLDGLKDNCTFDTMTFN